MSEALHSRTMHAIEDKVLVSTCRGLGMRDRHAEARRCSDTGMQKLRDAN